MKFSKTELYVLQLIWMWGAMIIGGFLFMYLIASLATGKFKGKENETKGYKKPTNSAAS